MSYSRRKKMCDGDCFNCHFEDCVNEELEFNDYLEIEHIDKYIIDSFEQKNARKMSSYAQKKKKEYFSNNPSDSKAYAKAYYELNRERYVRYRLENRDRKSAYDKSYFEKNHDKVNEKNKIYGQNNKEHLRERRKEWREKNREKIREYQREYYHKKILAEKTVETQDKK